MQPQRKQDAILIENAAATPRFFMTASGVSRSLADDWDWRRYGAVA
jgi:hypothetical protein